MNRLLSHRYLFRHNLFALMGVCVCVYFSYHALQGDRSALRLWQLNSSIATMSQEFQETHLNRVEIEKKVLMMRPGSVNQDLLEERVRLVLGYAHKNDFSIFSD